MSKLLNIVQSESEPRTTDIWLKDGKLKYFSSNGWEDIKLSIVSEEGEVLNFSTLNNKINQAIRDIEYIKNNAVTSSGTTVETASLAVKSFNEPYWEYDESYPNNRYKAEVISNTELHINQILDPSTPNIIHNWWAYAYARTLKEGAQITVTMSCDGFVIVDGKLVNEDGTKQSFRISTIPCTANTPVTADIASIYQEGVTYDNIYMYFLPSSMEQADYIVKIVDNT